MFEHATVRFITSGTLITLYAVTEIIARRRGHHAATAPAPRWLRPVHIVSVLAFYALIGPTGGPLAGGHGNLAGIALAAAAFALRLGPWVRHPDLAGQTMFHLGLPIAVGVPWGLLVVSVPAIVTSVVLCRGAERARDTIETERSRASVATERSRASIATERAHASVAPEPRPAYRLIPGIW